MDSNDKYLINLELLILSIQRFIFIPVSLKNNGIKHTDVR
jgi:hypothetical protein